MVAFELFFDESKIVSLVAKGENREDITSVIHFSIGSIWRCAGSSTPCHRI